MPLQCDEGADFMTFRIGLFGLEKWHNVDKTVANLAGALDRIGVVERVAEVVAGITKARLLLAMQQAVRFCEVMYVPCCAAHGMYEPGLSISACVGFHANVALVAFLARMHLGVSRLVFVIGGSRRCSQGGIHDCSGLEQQATLGQEVVDCGQDLLSQFALFQPVAKAQYGGLVGQAGELLKLRKLAQHGGVKEGFFHCGI
jgi:hypothetical protein